jgi:hypothetical protein
MYDFLIWSPNLGHTRPICICNILNFNLQLAIQTYPSQRPLFRKIYQICIACVIYSCNPAPRFELWNVCLYVYLFTCLHHGTVYKSGSLSTREVHFKNFESLSSPFYIAWGRILGRNWGISLKSFPPCLHHGTVYKSGSLSIRKVHFKNFESLSSPFFIAWGQILGRNWGNSLKSFPPFYSQSHLLTDSPPPPSRAKVVWNWFVM